MTSQSIKISVIMPVYNVEKYLERCLSSICHQTYQNIEIICIDDGSTDKSLEILKQFQDRDERIKIISQQNGGVSKARNKGLSEATGSYIYFMDSDDALHPQTFEICLHFALKHQAELVCFGFKPSDGHLLETSPVDISALKSYDTDNPLFRCLQSGPFRIPFNVWTKFYAAELLKNTRFVENIYFEDAPHTIEMLLKHPKTVIIDANLYFYTKNLSSISHQKATLKSLQDYRTGMLQMYTAALKSGSKKDLQYIRHVIFPRYINNQYKYCRQASPERRHELYTYFAQSLKQYKKYKLIDWTGCGLFKSLRYIYLMLKY
ncbi:MAG: glycosyltransferase family 2 protein [Alphaproteobacteria bacterium]|nr:glycosyltransferase family 2 protein [Alphaproteobacteria bacterium]